MSTTGSTMEILNAYDNFVQSNYDRLYTHALVTTRDREYASDLLGDVYIAIKEMIIASGYTTQRFITYFCKSITNTWIDKLRKDNSRNKRYKFETDDSLVNKEYEDNYMEEEHLMREREYKCNMIFNYIEQKYTDRECYIFKTYFLFPPDKRMTFQVIADMTGMSTGFCSETIKKIREDIRNNFC